jgi:hypothetical protein
MKEKILAAVLLLTPLFIPSLPVNSLESVTGQPTPLPSTNRAQVPQPIQLIQRTDIISQQTANVYPPEIVKDFISICTKQSPVSGVNLEPICACSIKRIQDQYTLSQFISIASEMTETKKPPEKLVNIAMQCALENLPGR